MQTQNYDNMCSICLQPMSAGGDLFITACNHKFHFNCITSSVRARNYECPLCRVKLDALVKLFQGQSQQQQPQSQMLFHGQQYQQPQSQMLFQGQQYQQLQPQMIRQNAYPNHIPVQLLPIPTLAVADVEDLVEEERIRQQAEQLINNCQTVQMPLIDVQTTLEFGAQPTAQQSCIYGMVSLKAPSMPAVDSGDLRRVPLDLVCVIDRSGSMAHKMALVRDTLSYILHELQPTDRLSLISFDDTAQSVSGGLKFANNQRLQEQINSLKDGGGTYIGSGLTMAIDQLRNRQTKNLLSSILLLTDGQDNQPHDYSQLMQGLPQNTTVHTFGYGSDHQASLLSRLAEQGNNGTYTYIDQVDAVGVAFATTLGGLFTCIAQQLEIRLEMQNGYTIEKVQTTYPYTPMQLPCDTVVIRLNDLNADERRDLMFQLNVPIVKEEQNENSSSVGTVTVRYTDPSTKSTLTTPSVPFRLLRHHEIDRLSPLLQTNYALDIQRNRTLTTLALRQALQFTEEGNTERCNAVLQQAITVIEKSVSKQDPLCQQLIQDLRRQYRSKEEFLSANCNVMNQHSNQRGTYSTGYVASTNAYLTPVQQQQQFSNQQYQKHS
ncbi:unnamed protein product [Didymodactylos carnosus]|uniref:Uncharacterized protein n=1 Tax=Didymodactylos carnosus TaxID=1234261 RepID=A0A813Z913_9BILA|nr:unnamed protein product [Didymodactylos carnosus]CAF0895607.1 unnamed protein product [Didymodactylos carnosus]CAF3632425.1 unnamed protein product [Didymodactylos carnosus]CAF3678935.1 unnamed protein product [Didymodactylos carnosus]